MAAAPDDIGGPYSDEELEAALRTNGREIRFRYELLGKEGDSQGFINSVQPGARITYNWLADIKRTGEFNMIADEDFEGINFASDTLKPYMHLKMPDGLWASFPLGVFILDNPSRTSEGGRVLHSVKVYDRGKHLREEQLSFRWVLKKGANVIDAVRDRLDYRGLPHDLPDDDETLAADRSWDIGTSFAVIVNDLLNMVNYGSVYFDAHGVARAEPYILPGDREPNFTYVTDELSVTQEQATEEIDLFNVPNRWIMTVGQPDRDELVATYTNNDPDSPTSVQARGRVITRQEQGDEDATSQAVLNDKVRRLAHADSSVYGHVTFQTNLDPRHGENDTIRLTHDPLGIDADYSETEWSMTLKAGEVMTHNARLKVDLRGDPDLLVTGGATVAPTEFLKTTLKAAEFVGNPQSPLTVITQVRSAFPGTTDAGTVRGYSSNRTSPVGTNIHLYQNSLFAREVMYVAVGTPDDDANIATGSITATSTAGAITSVPITFGKTLTGTVRVFFEVVGGAPHNTRRIGVTSVTSTGATLNFMKINNNKTPLRWVAIGDDAGLDNVAVGTTTIAVGSAPGVGSSAIAFGKTLEAPVRVFSLPNSSSLLQGLTAAGSISETAATLYAYRENTATITHNWIAIGGRGDGADEDATE